jgi:all-trans-retinol 13,14-reductase
MGLQFPDQSAAIDEYVELIKSIGKPMRQFSMRKTLPDWLNKIIDFTKIGKFPSYMFENTYEVLSRFISDDKLIAVLCGQWGDHGVPPKESVFMMHAIIASHYLRGAYYPIGGASRISETIIPQIQASGGEVFIYADVKEIVIRNGKAVGVLMADGQTIYAERIISNAGVMNTFNKLLPKGISEKYGYAKKMQHLESSMGHLGMYIGLKGSTEELGLSQTNLWLYADEHYEKNIQDFKEDYSKPLPVVYISFPSAKDPDFERRYSGRSTIEIVAPCPYEIFEKWKDEPWGKRGDDYDLLKEELSQRMLEILYQKMPQLRGKIDYYETSTPLSTDFFCRYERGELYGIDHTQQRFAQQWLKPKTDIPGLYLTGQDILTCGVCGAMMAGMITAMQIVGFRRTGQLMKNIQTGKTLPVTSIID